MRAAGLHGVDVQRWGSTRADVAGELSQRSHCDVHSQRKRLGSLALRGGPIRRDCQLFHVAHDVAEPAT